jgi:adenosylcobinamide kinase/adenosylcobinamide-phosphate guanylyltransferase
MANIVLILGGVRSGKSHFAQDLAQSLGGNDVLFVATGEAGDDEMARRIRHHRETRPAEWETLEAPTSVGAIFGRISIKQHVVLIDCLTLLVSNVLFSCGEPYDHSLIESRVAEEVTQLLAACKQLEGTVIIVSGEVGLGVVPESALGRFYRDLLGRANQQVAREADKTFFMVAGLALELKSLSQSVEQVAEQIRRGQS